MSAHDDLLAFVNHLFPVGNPNRVRLLQLLEADRAEFAAAMVEAHARPPWKPDGRARSGRRPAAKDGLA